LSLTNRNIVKQSYELNNARYSLSALETDLIMKMIAEIDTNDEDFKLYRFKVTDLEQKLGKRLDRQSLKNLALNLRKKNLSIEKESGFLVTGWVSSFEYFSKSGETELCFDSKLKPYLLQLKSHFVKTDIQQIFKISTEYGKRLYMIFKQRETLSSYKINLIELQKMLEVPKSLEVYSNFKLKVLAPSKDQINSKTDLEVDFKEIKTGRAVTALEFTIKKKIGQQLTLGDFSRETIDTREVNFLSYIDKKLKGFKSIPTRERELEFKKLCEFNGVDFSKELIKEAMKRLE
jgi:plasmid replication initiation protein